MKMKPRIDSISTLNTLSINTTLRTERINENKLSL